MFTLPVRRDRIGCCFVANGTAYVHRGWGEQDSEQRKKENVGFVVNAVAALEQACPKMKFLTFPTGGKVLYYILHPAASEPKSGLTSTTVVWI